MGILQAGCDAISFIPQQSLQRLYTNVSIAMP
jgi:hypothetical protein